ncbi:MAG TPA: hypothetical protein HA360_01285 [Nanoarchaeota archaeon]|nr:hypothetical protein [Candidatus Woesearchaeota archaeon]HIH15654.1 hypothetical protein [Nanoarchaeota archaeon]HIH58763.1 hypothetical protein [Nanoarchaeota archaeon]HII13685.1 hypothetical protein [Nanoarchaeota archaeon]HIJ05379.1 hypothetical protein [Nanoarchaeota archaeon]
MSHREIIEVREGRWLLEQIKEKVITICPHAFEKIYQAQRTLFTEEALKLPLQREVPHFVALQQNGRYTIYYHRKNFFLNIIIEIKEGEIEVVSFMKKDTLPILRT